MFLTWQLCLVECMHTSTVLAASHTKSVRLEGSCQDEAKRTMCCTLFPAADTSLAACKVGMDYEGSRQCAGERAPLNQDCQRIFCSIERPCHGQPMECGSRSLFCDPCKGQDGPGRDACPRTLPPTLLSGTADQRQKQCWRVSRGASAANN